MSVEVKVYLDDILGCIEKIEGYTNGISYGEFSSNGLVVDAVLRNLEIIGEATKKIPQEIKKRHANIEWKKMAGLRDILIHEYSGVNLQIVWDVIKNKLPILKDQVQKICKEN